MWRQWISRSLSIYTLFLGISNIISGIYFLYENISLTQEFADKTFLLGGISSVIAGIFLLFLSIGLFRCSVIAWLLTLVFSITALGGHYLSQDFLLPSIIHIPLITLLLFTFRFFYQRLDVKIEHLVALFAVVSVLAYGILVCQWIGNQFEPNINTVSEAVYFTIVTISSVGYGDYVPTTPFARLFVVSLVVMGLGAVYTAVILLIGPLLMVKLRELFTQVGRGVSRMRNHIIIAGYSAEARNLIQILRSRNFRYLLIVASPELADELSGRGYNVIAGDATDEEVMAKANLKKSIGVAALHEDDAENAFVTLSIKNTMPKIMVVAKAATEKSVDKLKSAGADMVISPAILGGLIFAKVLTTRDKEAYEVTKDYLKFIEEMK